MFNYRRFDLYLASKFSALGSCVGRSPGVFILVPILITMLMGSGVQQFVYLSDIFYLFVPVDARSIQDHSKINSYFPENLTRHIRGSELRFHQVVDIILVPQEGKSALSKEVWTEATLIAQAASNISVYLEGRTYSWYDLCAKFDGECVDNLFLHLLESTNVDSDMMNNLTYPVMKDPAKDEVYYPLVAHLGGVEKENGFILNAEALRLFFMLDDSSRSLKQASQMWSNAMNAFAHKLQLNSSSVSAFNFPDIEREVVDNVQTAFENNLPLAVITVAAYTMVNCMSTDWVRSKPLMGVVGLVCVILSSFSGCGLCLYLGFSWQAINVVVVFLLIGIGMDGVFLMLSAWARSEAVSRDMVTRMSITYADASVSLTITSLTNVLSFLVGAIIPGFPCVQIFCMYAGVSLVFNYFWTITIFGAFLAISGHMELSNRHCLLLTKVKSKTMAENSNFFYKLFLAGGTSVIDPDNPRDNKGEKMMSFFGNIVTPFLNYAPTKCLILCTFFSYMAVSFYGIFNIKEGLELPNLVIFNSSVASFFNREKYYFKDHAFRIQFAILDELDYHDEHVQEQYFSLVSELEQSFYIFNSVKFRQSWLHEFTKVASENFVLFNISTKAQFMTSLQIFLEEADQISRDVSFSVDNSRIVASRFFLSTGRIDDAYTEMLLMLDLRNIVAKYPFEVAVFTPLFYLVDQYVEIFENTILCVIVCSIIMSVVIFIFIPNKMCVIWVTFTVMSVEFGVVGLMPFLGIHLEMISMIVLIMGIGFSVDFSAHISYHYLAADEGTSPEERLAHCLHALGPPIIQAAITTVCCVLPLMRHPSYVAHTFAKMISLVIFLGLLHSLLLLPVLLSLFGPDSCGKSKKTKSYASNVLSPSTVSLSDTFMYQNGKDNPLKKNVVVKQALIQSKATRNVNNNVEEEKKICTKTSKESSLASLHMSFFQSLENDDGTTNKVEIENSLRSLKDRTRSDSSYYSYQKRHLRRHVKPIESKRRSVDIRSKSMNDDSNADTSFPSRLESIRRSLILKNNKYDLMKDGFNGTENDAYDESEANKSNLSTFKPDDFKVCEAKLESKLVLFDHSAPNAADDKFEEINLNND